MDEYDFEYDVAYLEEGMDTAEDCWDFTDDNRDYVESLLYDF